MRVFNIRMGYIYDSDADKRKEKVIQRDYQLRECGITVPLRKPDDPYSGDYDNVVATGDQLLSLMTEKIEFSVVSEANLEREPEAMMNNITEALAKIDKYFQNVGAAHDNWNSRVTVHMPGQALSMYNKTMLLNDSCTDGLQDELDKGWRIIACCPQPDQRRPDYILGRFDPDPKHYGNGAEKPDYREHTDVKPQAPIAPPPTIISVRKVNTPGEYHCCCGRETRATPGAWTCSHEDCIPF